jgi:hypothetical protein
MSLPGPGADDDLLFELADSLKTLADSVREHRPDARELRYRLVEGLVARGWLLELASWLYRRPPLDDGETELLLGVLAAKQRQEAYLKDFEAKVEDRKKERSR